MFSKAIFTSAVTLALAGQVFGHCAIQPQLGVQGNSTRNDVQRPSQSAECGTTNIAQTIDSSTAVPLDATNSFAATAVNFNAGQDGSTQVTALVDPTGTGNSFVAATVTKNGILAPTTVAPADLAITLPAGTTCTGGAAKNLCLVSFTTAGGSVTAWSSRRPLPALEQQQPTPRPLLERQQRTRPPQLARLARPPLTRPQPARLARPALPTRPRPRLASITVTIITRVLRVLRVLPLVLVLLPVPPPLVLPPPTPPLLAALSAPALPVLSSSASTTKASTSSALSSVAS